MSDTTITPEERNLLKKVHRQGWNIDEGDMCIYRNIDGEITCKLASDFESPEILARELSQVWQSAWPIVVRLETALEAAEKALLKEEVYSEELESQLQDAESEYNANWAVQAITDVARLVGVYEQCSETGDDIGATTIEAVQNLKTEKERAEAETARLRAERDWLASWGDAHPCCMDLQCPFGRTLEQCEAREGGMLDSTECWLEAARRAVAGEGESS